MMKVAKEWYVCSNFYIEQIANQEVSDLTICLIINTESLKLVLVLNVSSLLSVQIWTWDCRRECPKEVKVNTNARGKFKFKMQGWKHMG